MPAAGDRSVTDNFIESVDRAYQVLRNGLQRHAARKVFTNCHVYTGKHRPESVEAPPHIEARNGALGSMGSSLPRFHDARCTRTKHEKASNPSLAACLVGRPLLARGRVRFSVKTALIIHRLIIRLHRRARLAPRSSNISTNVINFYRRASSLAEIANHRTDTHLR